MPHPNFYYVGDCGPHYFPECIVAYWIWRIIPTSLLVIGTFGNILNVVILSRKQMRKHSTTTFLLALAITELTVLWVAVAPDINTSITGSRIIDASPVTCRLRWWMALTFGSLSTWLLVLLTLERTLLIRAPSFSKRKITPRNVLIVCLVVGFVIAAVNSHMIFGLRYQEITESLPLGHNATIAHAAPFNCYFRSAEYANFYTNFWHKAVLLIYNLIPAGLIVVGNINIVIMLLLQRRGIARVNPVTHPGDGLKRKSSAKMLFTLSVFYILTTTPWCVYFILRGYITKLTAEGLAKWQLATAIVNALVGCNFSLNFFLYFVSGTLFKKEWRRLLQNAKYRLPKLCKATPRDLQERGVR